MKKTLFFVLAISTIVIFSCDDGDSKKIAQKPEGSEGGPCYGNKTCDDDLVCEDGICVDPEKTEDEITDETADETADEIVDETAEETVDEVNDEIDDEDFDNVNSDEESDGEPDEDLDETPDVEVEGWEQVVVNRDRSENNVGTTCGLYNKSMLCWGSNSWALYGNGNQISSTSPVPAGNGKEWSAITISGSGACGLDTDGYLFCWGYSNNILNEIPPVLVPVKMTERRFINFHGYPGWVCGLTGEGDEWCYDRTQKGFVLARQGITGYWPDPIEELSFISRNNHIGVTTDGGIAASFNSVWNIWPNPLRNVPDMSLLMQADGELADNTTGLGTYCGIDINHTLWCWSSVDNPIIGNPEESFKGESEYKYNYQKKIIDATSISVTRLHACAITAGKKLFCWGTNNSGQIGIGTASSDPIYEPVEILPF